MSYDLSQKIGEGTFRSRFLHFDVGWRGMGKEEVSSKEKPTGESVSASISSFAPFLVLPVWDTGGYSEA